MRDDIIPLFLIWLSGDAGRAWESQLYKADWCQECFPLVVAPVDSGGECQLCGSNPAKYKNRNCSTLTGTASCPQPNSRKGVRSDGTRDWDCYELWCHCWDPVGNSPSPVHPVAKQVIMSHLWTRPSLRGELFSANMKRCPQYNLSPPPHLWQVIIIFWWWWRWKILESLHSSVQCKLQTSQLTVWRRNSGIWSQSGDTETQPFQ